MLHAANVNFLGGTNVATTPFVNERNTTRNEEENKLPEPGADEKCNFAA